MLPGTARRSHRYSTRLNQAAHSNRSVMVIQAGSEGRRAALPRGTLRSYLRRRMSSRAEEESARTPSGVEPSVRAAPVIPDHQLLRCIGQGSYGEVWLGRNVLGEYRAVKV